MINSVKKDASIEIKKIALINNFKRDFLILFVASEFCKINLELILINISKILAQSGNTDTF